MPVPPATPDLDSDPEIQQALAELQQNVEQAEVELPQIVQELETAPRLSLSQDEPPPDDPVADARWQEIERKVGVNVSKTGGKILEVLGVEGVEKSKGVQWKELGGELLEDLAEKAVERGAHKAGKLRITPPPVPKQRREWHYVQNEEALGPVAETALLELLKSGELKWSALVWHEALTEWVAASETDLVELSGGKRPPPIPKKKGK
jgi:hypothetical protein